MSKRFEDRPYPDEIVGTKYRVTNALKNEEYCNGDIVALHDCIKSIAPFFVTPRGTSECIYWEELSPYEEPTESQGKPAQYKPVQVARCSDQLSQENHKLKQDIKKLEDYILRTARV